MASKRQPVQCYLMSPPREWCPRNVNIQHVLVLLCFLLGCICSCFVLHGTACGWLVTELHNLFQQAFSHEIVSPWSYALALFYTWLTTYDRRTRGGSSLGAGKAPLKHEVLEEEKKGREEKEMHVEEEDKSPPNTQDCIRHWEELRRDWSLVW